MKKIGLICAALLAGISLTACSNSASQKSNKKSSSSSVTTTKAVKHHKVRKESKKDTQSSSSSAVSSQSNSQASQTSTQQSVQSSNNQQQGAQSGVTKSQSEINRERGYDPNGAPLLPGQDHAAGSKAKLTVNVVMIQMVPHSCRAKITLPDLILMVPLTLGYKVK